MFKKVVLCAFEKAQKDISGRSNKTSRSEHISTVLLNEFKCPISGKTLRNLYDKSIDPSTNGDISINSNYVENLCLYLGFENYNAFLKKNLKHKDLNKREKSISFIKHNKTLLIISLLIISIILFMTSFNKKRWMVWEENSYVEVNFDAEKYTLSQLKIYNEERIEKFKKILPNCETSFFHEDGTPKVWYGKNKGKLEYFTSLAKHPENGKALKAITNYMIKKHICK